MKMKTVIRKRPIARLGILEDRLCFIAIYFLIRKLSNETGVGALLCKLFLSNLELFLCEFVVLEAFDDLDFPVSEALNREREAEVFADIVRSALTSDQSHRHPGVGVAQIPVSKNNYFLYLRWSFTALAAERALESLRALIIAAPRFWTVVMKSPLSQSSLSLRTSVTGLPPTVALATSGN